MSKKSNECFLKRSFVGDVSNCEVEGSSAKNEKVCEDVIREVKCNRNNEKERCIKVSKEKSEIKKEERNESKKNVIEVKLKNGME